MSKIDVKQSIWRVRQIAINPKNYRSDCYACNCLRWCYAHRHGMNATPNLMTIDAIVNGVPVSSK